MAVSRVPITVKDSPNSFKLAAESKLVVGQGADAEHVAVDAEGGDGIDE